MAEDTSNVDFLKSLSAADTAALDRFIGEKVVSQDVVNGAVPDGFKYYVALDENASPMSGAAWLDYATCKITTGGTGILMEMYPRFQVQFNRRQDGSYITPQKRMLGVDPIGKQLKSQLSVDGWGEFKAMVSGSAAKVSIKILLHHIAYAAKRAADPALAPLPAATGSGSSISHLCDNPKCRRRKHLVVAGSHQENLARQRCPGVTLLCLSGVILQTQHCPHYSCDEDGNILSPDCARLNVVALDMSTVGIAEERSEAFREAEANFNAAFDAANL